MYYVIDFADKTEGMYTLKSKMGNIAADPHLVQGIKIPRDLMLTTYPDLEMCSTVVDEKFASDYFPVTIDMINSQDFMIDAIKSFKHYILVGETWEMPAKIRKIHPACIELGFNAGEKCYVSEFGLGEPV